MKQKIGILGGAFNPPHKGHLLIANKVFKKLKLDKIFLIPFGLSPLKKKRLAPAKDRLEMTRLLIGKNPKFSVLDYEIKKAKKRKKSYTIETIRYLKKKFKNSEIFWIIGEDSLREIIEGKWRGGLKVLNLAQFVVATRPHHPFSFKKVKPEFKNITKAVLEKVIIIKINIPISATEIRRRIKTGENVFSFLPRNVLNYLKKKKLYAQENLY